MTFLYVDTSKLDALFNELGEAADAAARPASQAAAQVLYDEVRRNVSALPQKTGNLLRSIHQVYVQKRSGPGLATYAVSWNYTKAPHGHLVEFGHIQRYVTYMGSDGNFYTAKRKSSKGKPKPKRSAPQAVKDAYYVPLPVPIHVGAKSFVRRAQTKFPDAMQAAESVLLKAINDT